MAEHNEIEKNADALNVAPIWRTEVSKLSQGL